MMPRILAVDDDQAIRKLYQVSLGNRYEVEVAESGEKALAACAKGFPDLVLLDVGMPDEAVDPERNGQLRDDVVILAETTEGLCESVDMRIESMQRAERLQITLGGASNALVTMRRDYYGLLGDTRLRLQQLIDQVEHGFSWMGMSEENEREFIRTIHRDLDPLLSTLAEGGNFESHFSHVMDALRGGKQNDALELF